MSSQETAIPEVVEAIQEPEEINEENLPKAIKPPPLAQFYQREK